MFVVEYCLCFRRMSRVERSIIYICFWSVYFGFRVGDVMVFEAGVVSFLRSFFFI